MRYTKLEVFQRLRDFKVPAAVLDTIFADKDDLLILMNAWNELAKDGLTGDEIAAEISALIFSEGKVTPEDDYNAPEK